MKINIFRFLFLCLFSSCALRPSSSELVKLRLGMTEEQVVKTLKQQPDSAGYLDNNIRYIVYKIQHGMSGYVITNFYFKNDKLIKFGKDEGAQRKAIQQWDNLGSAITEERKMQMERDKTERKKSITCTNDSFSNSTTCREN